MVSFSTKVVAFLTQYSIGPTQFDSNFGQHGKMVAQNDIINKQHGIIPTIW
jgi:hypothetical protein